MTADPQGSIPTRQSLLERLKDLGNQEDWRRFFETYWRLIHATALKAGLTAAEAEDVVQEVMIAAAGKLPEFTYRPGKDSLKGWLLAVTRWKIADQYRRRGRGAGSAEPPPTNGPAPRGPEADGTARTATTDGVPDPNPPELERHWEQEWQQNLLRAALDRVRQQVNPAHYEIYHLAVVQGLSARETARVLKVGVAQVYLARHRVGRRVNVELARLQTSPG